MRLARLTGVAAAGRKQIDEAKVADRGDMYRVPLPLASQPCLHIKPDDARWFVCMFVIVCVCCRLRMSEKAVTFNRFNAHVQLPFI